MIILSLSENHVCSLLADDCFTKFSNTCVVDKKITAASNKKHLRTMIIEFAELVYIYTNMKKYIEKKLGIKKGFIKQMDLEDMK